jgi:hypothetical protein
MRSLQTRRRTQKSTVSLAKLKALTSCTPQPFGSRQSATLRWARSYSSVTEEITISPLKSLGRGARRIVRATTHCSGAPPPPPPPFATWATAWKGPPTQLDHESEKRLLIETKTIGFALFFFFPALKQQCGPSAVRITVSPGISRKRAKCKLNSICYQFRCRIRTLAGEEGWQSPHCVHRCRAAAARRKLSNGSLDSPPSSTPPSATPLWSTTRSIIERKISDLSDAEYKLFTSYTETRALGLGRLERGNERS